MSELSMELGAKALLKQVADRVVAYSPNIARIVGGACQGIFIAQLLWLYHNDFNPERWVEWTAQQVSEQTALSRSEQETARRKLVSLGLIQERVFGIPGKNHYRIDFDRLVYLLVYGPPKKEKHPQEEDGAQTSLQETDKVDCENPANSGVANQHSNYLDIIDNNIELPAANAAETPLTPTDEAQGEKDNPSPVALISSGEEPLPVAPTSVKAENAPRGVERKSGESISWVDIANAPDHPGRQAATVKRARRKNGEDVGPEDDSNPQWAMMVALAQAFHQSLQINAGRLAGEAKAWLKRGVTTEQITDFCTWWALGLVWQSKGGQYPNSASMGDCWQFYLDWVTAGKPLPTAKTEVGAGSRGVLDLDAKPQVLDFDQGRGQVGYAYGPGR